MNILIVDDESVIREGIERTLKKHFPEHRIDLAAGPEEAVRLLRSKPVDLVLTDIRMPGMTGLELMNMSRGRHPDIKWVVMSAYSEFAYAQEAVRLGAKDYLLKPIGKEALVELIARVGEEIARESEWSRARSLLETNLKYLREAVFARWVSGLDIGRLDMKSFIEDYPRFHLVMVKMESDRAMQLEHFIVENVLSELIGQYGKGFVTSQGGSSLLGLVAVEAGDGVSGLVDELKKHLRRCLKVPFQVLHTDEIRDFGEVPERVRGLGEASATQSFEHYASGGDQAIEVALQYIKAHYRDELTLEKVAAVVYLNPVYFSQLFKQKTGRGFKEYVTQLRLEYARELLRNPRIKLADVAERSGYQDMRHFSQLFRRKYNVTPSEYRQKMNG
ncbi:DNA-binding response regulator [Paenibacillus cisolokensis]|uniref:DNA-binding response regulator n=1 Tax=Paenibacillus cisolokensis TaxID=1658519 RepID=A0ABQ4NBQ7_9BACL|nr:response regulator [Paenibacillus cisolokensis]GIQ65655.1 DNA-binding response regulator [Paenibacillus cisolokensis]